MGTAIQSSGSANSLLVPHLYLLKDTVELMKCTEWKRLLHLHSCLSCPVSYPQKVTESLYTCPELLILLISLGGNSKSSQGKPNREEVFINQMDVSRPRRHWVGQQRWRHGGQGREPWPPTLARGQKDKEQTAWKQREGWAASSEIQNKPNSARPWWSSG